MSGPSTGRASTAEALRAAFDHAFTLPDAPPAEASVDLLRVRAGGRSLALRCSGVTGLVALTRIARLPGSPPALLGLAGHRGALVPVWDLAELLGLPAGGPSRWMVLLPSGPALAFEVLEAQVTVPIAALVPCEPPPTPLTPTPEIVRDGATQVPVVDLVVAARLIGRAVAPRAP